MTAKIDTANPRPKITPRCRRGAASSMTMGDAAHEVRPAPAYPIVKPVAERILALAMFATALPIFVASIILVKMTSAGPAFYSQTRLGRGGRRFRIYKLRTMTHNCEAATGPVWSLTNDPRVTRVGRWLRDTHLDELPQLWNILRGDMSLVGPRPERPELAEQIERALPAFADRLQVRPGLTGLAQVCQPADVDLNTVHRKLAYDLHYIRSHGPLLDLRILLSTTMQLIGVAATSMSRMLVNRSATVAESSFAAEPLDADLDVDLRMLDSSTAAANERAVEMHIAA